MPTGRTKPDWYYRQSGVIPFRRAPTGDAISVLLITSRRKKRWIIPKGIVEPDLSPAESAQKEALEEAGVDGRVWMPAVGTYSYTKWNGMCRVEVFALGVHQEHSTWPESFRARSWMPLEDAADTVEEPNLKNLIKRLPAFLAEHVGG